MKRGAIAMNERGCLGLITSERATETRQWMGVSLQDFVWTHKGDVFHIRMGGFWQGTDGKLTIVEEDVRELRSRSVGDNT